ncbi:hypothetical protein TUMSATVNIG3_05270 [Vibrio nigripulchritudo]|nr:hypothetical protein TUMSATVNIG2_05430 [Vibrio nigripulchritudo]BDU41729.1 hypothetical protein TUMSATVNIG3_05270 [Vibrio nigripulchritudo]
MSAAPIEAARNVREEKDIELSYPVKPNPFGKVVGHRIKTSPFIIKEFVLTDTIRPR